MQYRREIDGLRAVAVVPVVLFHAGCPSFSGGFVGVDVFFVISGYLITTIILDDLAANRFSLARFYERRARRILPALFVVMAATTPFAYAWMMPDEFKNYGQSLVATTLFSNNILLALTSNYWSMANEFKPLLHTWSLGVEEQYYMIFPLLMLWAWASFRSRIALVLWTLMSVSFVGAVWGTVQAPTLAFYVLPTRAWEILAGALAAYHLLHARPRGASRVAEQVLSLLGLALVSLSIVTFSEATPSPGVSSLVPTVGTVLIILFAVEGTAVHRLLGLRPIVGLGLVSYSLYLWHQPLFALARVYSTGPVAPATILVLTAAAVVLAVLTWRFVERPFRDRALVGRRAIASVGVLGSLCAVAFGLHLNASYGMAWRVFDPDTQIRDMDKRFYNERAFSYKKDRFSSDDKLRILVSGNSYARDLVNMIVETFDTQRLEILYRDDLSECIGQPGSDAAGALFARADVVVFSNDYGYGCARENATLADRQGKQVFYIGTKEFGYNLNWIARLPADRRGGLYNPLPESVMGDERRMSSSVPAEHYISLLSPVVKAGQIPITDGSGRMLSTDRRHVTKYGAIFFGRQALFDSPLGLTIRGEPERSRETD